MPTAEFLHKFLIFPFLTATVVVNGLKLDRVVIPKKMHIGDVAVLKCPFELGKDRLYSVKWYKDGEEFFRYIPKYNPPMSEKVVSGVKVQMKGSTANQVSLELLSKNSTGIYKCQVSGEGPTFASVQREAHVRVHAPTAAATAGRGHGDDDGDELDDDNSAIQHHGFSTLLFCTAVHLYSISVE